MTGVKPDEPPGNRGKIPKTIVLRTMPTRKGIVFLCGLLNMWEKQILKFKNKIGGNHAFFNNICKKL